MGIINLQSFLDNFPLLAEAPNGVAKLRELFLQLAIEGKLVTQDSADEPASKLMQRIRSSKEGLSSWGKRSNEEAGPIQPQETPFTLPTSWEWVRLGQITNAVHYGYTASANHGVSAVRLLRITDIQNGKVDWSLVPGCDIDPDKLESVRLANRDILIARTGGTIGKSYLVNDLELTAVFASYLIRVVPNENLFAPYLKAFLESSLYWTQLYGKSMGTGQPNVNATSLKSLVVPLPPFEEQKRIVGKVDELMRLCDELEKREQRKRKSRVCLNDVTLAPLNNAASLAAEKLELAIGQLANNFATLYDSAETVGQLRSTILQLAIVGKLALQDATDEPADQLVGKFFEDIKKLKEENGMTHGSNPADLGWQLPNSWVPFRLGDLIRFVGGSQPAKSKFRYEAANGYTRLIQIRDYKSDAFKTYVPTEYANRPVTKDDVMIGRYGPPVFQILRGLEGTYNVALMKAAPIESVLTKDYLYYLLQEPKLQELVVAESERTAGQAGIRKELLHNYIAGLPPLAEQKRIVAKVNQLILLCDELETRLRQAEADSEKLMNAAVQHVLEAVTEALSANGPSNGLPHKHSTNA